MWQSNEKEYEMLRRRKIPVVDLFAGSGGLSLGATWAGCQVKASVELESVECQTLRQKPEIHGEVLQGDVADLDGAGLRTLAGIGVREPLIIVGGAPCQPFSKAAYWTEKGDEARYRRARASGVEVVRPPAPTEARPDERRDLVYQFGRLVIETAPSGFIFENVPSIKHPRNRAVLEGFTEMVEAAGYSTVEITANAAEYGVAQTRKRLFVLGAKKELPVPPKPTHSQDEEDTQFNLQPAVTAGEALEGLDVPDYFEPEEVVEGRWARHLAEVPPGGNYKAHTAWAGHPNPSFVTETRFWNFLLKLTPERPSWTLAASPGPWTGPFHWNNRRLRTPEMAALQGFPRGYRVAGNRRQRVRQMGNAAPPPLARAMVESVLGAIHG